MFNEYFEAAVRAECAKVCQLSRVQNGRDCNDVYRAITGAHM